MISQQTILIAILLLGLMPTMLLGEVIVEVNGNTILATTDKIGKNGFTGCQEDKLKETSAYIFRLEQLTGGSSPCGGSSSLSKWHVISEKKSKVGSVKFKDLPEGKFKVTCMIGEDIGCLREDGARSIVYGKVESSIIQISSSTQTKLDSVVNSLTNKKEYLKVYPNPANDQISILFESNQIEGILNLRIYDITGNLHKSIPVNYTKSTQLNVEVIISFLSPGTYIVTLENKDSGLQLNRKLLIQNNY